MATRKLKGELGYWVPKTALEVERAIAEMGTKQRERQLLESAMNDEIEATRKRFAAAVLPLDERLAVLQRGVGAYCQTYRDELTEHGKTKTAVFNSGEVRWRLTPWRVAVHGVAEVIKMLRKKRLSKFIRTKVEINKQALLEAREALAARELPGISFLQDEEMIIVPNETPVEVVAE